MNSRNKNNKHTFKPPTIFHVALGLPKTPLCLSFSICISGVSATSEPADSTKNPVLTKNSATFFL